MKRSAIVGGSLVFVIVCAFVAWRLISAPQLAHEEEKHEGGDPIKIEVATVRSAPISSSVVVRGILRPVQNGESNVAAQAAGRVKEVLVRPGQVVKRGQVLVITDRSDLQAAQLGAEAAAQEAGLEEAARKLDVGTLSLTLKAQEDRAQSKLRAAEAVLARIRSGARPEEIDRAEATLQTARADLDRLRKGPRAQEISQAEAAVQESQAILSARTKDAERKKSLLQRGIVAARDYELAEADRASAQATLASRREALQLLKIGTRPEEIAAQEARVREATAAFELLRKGSRPEEIAEAEQNVLGAKADLADARAARANLPAQVNRVNAAKRHAQALTEAAAAARAQAGRQETRAPIDGVVTSVMVNPGDGVAEQAPLVTISDVRMMRAVLSIPESYKDHAIAGATVELTIPGMDDFKLSTHMRARVDQADPETGLLVAEALVPNADRKLNAGMPVVATIKQTTKRSGILVPSRAVFSREGEYKVYLIEGDEAKEQVVEVAGEQGQDMEITKGLKAGDRVAADGSISLADGTKVDTGK